MGKRIHTYSVHAIQLVKEASKVYNLEDRKVRSPADAYDIIKEILDMQGLPNENFIMLSLNTKNEVMGFHTIFVGTLNASIVHPREIYQRALLNNASSIVVAHNHPSGTTTPSPEDISVTERLVNAGKLMGIDLIDHLIIGKGFVSLRELGHMD